MLREKNADHFNIAHANRNQFACFVTAKETWIVFRQTVIEVGTKLHHHILGEFGGVGSPLPHEECSEQGQDDHVDQDRHDLLATFGARGSILGFGNGDIQERLNRLKRERRGKCR